MSVTLLTWFNQVVPALRSPSVPDLARVAGALADRSRATMVQCLLDGRAWTASELAAAAGVSRSTATTHLHHLVNVGLLCETRQGRHRYVRLADPGTAEAVEALAAVAARAGHVSPAAPAYSARRADARLHIARSCYGHLAGRLGVSLADGLRAVGRVSPRWELTGDGYRWFSDLDISLPERTNRPLLRPCLDWTERREHLAGVAADALLTYYSSRLAWCGVPPPGPWH